MESFELILLFAFIFIVTLIILLSTETYSKDESISYWVGQKIGIEPNYIITNGTAELTIRNNLGHKISILDITFNGKGYLEKEVNLENGEFKDVVVHGIPRCASGSIYSYKVSILYKDVRTNKTFVFEGKVPLVGKCE